MYGKVGRKILKNNIIALEKTFRWYLQLIVLSTDIKEPIQLFLEKELTFKNFFWGGGGGGGAVNIIAIII